MRADISGVGDRVSLHNMSVDALDFPDESFDAVVGVFLLHHLDLARCLEQMHRVMRPGAVAVFVETWARNKLLMAARATLTGRFGIDRAGSDDETPLDQTACRLLARGPFRRIEYRFPDLLFFRMACYIPWARLGPLPALWRTLDGVAGAIPGMRSFSYFTVVSLQK
jgi:SAM-dependent methyltransferase